MVTFNAASLAPIFPLISSVQRQQLLAELSSSATFGSPSAAFSYFSCGNALPPLSSCFFFPPPERCPLSICRFNATGSRWARLIDGALLESPVSRTHTHAAACTDERAATYTSENELWVKIGRVRKSTFHFQRTSSCATSRGHLRPPLSPSFVLFPPPSAPPCSRSLRRLCFRKPSPTRRRSSHRRSLYALAQTQFPRVSTTGHRSSSF